jgi:hypothetical protein
MRAKDFFAENFLIADCKEFFLFRDPSSLLREWCNQKNCSQKNVVRQISAGTFLKAKTARDGHGKKKFVFSRNRPLVAEESQS